MSSPPAQLSKKPSMIWVWGGHRNPAVEDRQTTPSQIDKGARELEEMGVQIRSVYPALAATWLPRWISSKTRLRGRINRVLGTIRLITLARSTSDVIYTTSDDWANVVARLKNWGLIRNNFVYRWSGFDLNFTELKVNKALQARYRRVIEESICCWIDSATEARLVRDAFPDLGHKIVFYPTPADLTFYQGYAPIGPDFDYDLVAIGSDAKRDWEVPLKLGRRGLKVAIVTGAKGVERQFYAIPESERKTISMIVGASFHQSASVLQRSRVVLVSTLPNLRFSGSTTVAAAIAMGQPVLMDEPLDMEAHGLVRDINFAYFVRGDANHAYTVATNILSNPSLQKKLGENIAALSPSVDVYAYLDRLKPCLFKARIPEDFTPPDNIAT